MPSGLFKNYRVVYCRKQHSWDIQIVVKEYVGPPTMLKSVSIFVCDEPYNEFQ